MAHRWPDSPLGRFLHALEAHYGVPAPPPPSGPFEMVLWEIVAYLADDTRRARAFEDLRAKVGFSPQAILAAPSGVLREVTRAGGAIAFEQRAERLRTAASLVVDEFGGDLSTALRLPARKAVHALRRFPMIGEPGAEKILLLCGSVPVLALDSNGLRVLVRLGFAEEGASYAATYKAVRLAVADQLPRDTSLLTAAHLLLRLHGRQLCVANSPDCPVCPLRAACPYPRDA